MASYISFWEFSVSANSRILKKERSDFQQFAEIRETICGNYLAIQIMRIRQL